MIAGKDEYLNEASSELFKRLTDLTVQEECEARERYYKEKQYMVDLEKRIKKAQKDLAERDKDLAERDKDLAEKREENKRLRELLEQNSIPY